MLTDIFWLSCTNICVEKKILDSILLQNIFNNIFMKMLVNIF
jgi:hypothetical protein